MKGVKSFSYNRTDSSLIVKQISEKIRKMGKFHKLCNMKACATSTNFISLSINHISAKDRKLPLNKANKNGSNFFQITAVLLLKLKAVSFLHLDSR
jgi:hypothetical protein